MRLNSFRLSEYFNLTEFQCPCCHTVKLHPELLRRASKLRAALGQPLIINSAYRCEKRNRLVGGVIDSRHRLGRALDVRVRQTSQEEFRRLALFCGFAKVILYPKRNFAHIEI